MRNSHFVRSLREHKRPPQKKAANHPEIKVLHRESGQQNGTCYFFMIEKNLIPLYVLDFAVLHFIVTVF